MDSYQIYKNADRLVQHYGTNDPIELCDDMGIMLRQHRTISSYRFCRTSACRFSVISHKNLLTYASMPASFLCNLSKKLTAHLHDNNCAVLP